MENEEKLGRVINDRDLYMMRKRKAISKIEQKELDALAKPKRVFGKVVREAIDFGRLSEEEYQSYCRTLPTKTWTIEEW